MRERTERKNPKRTNENADNKNYVFPALRATSVIIYVLTPNHNRTQQNTSINTHRCATLQCRRRKLCNPKD